MLEILKKQSKKTNLINTIVSLVVMVVLLAVSKFAIFDIITGPTKLDITADPAAYSGKYVTIDAEYFLYDYVDHTTTTKKKYGGSTTNVNGQSYVVFQSINDYENETSTWYFYSIYLDKNKQDEMYDKIEQAFNYWGDEAGTTAPPDPVTLTGTWSPMDAEMEQYFRSALTSLEVVEGEYDKFLFYELDTKSLGGLNRPLFWVLMAVAAGCLLFALASIAGMFGNGYLKEINHYLQKDTSASMSAIEADFNQARPVGKHAWIGKQWTIFMAGSKAKILANKDLVWGYYFRRTGRNSVSEMRLYTIDKKLTSISLSESETQQALKYYAEDQPQMVLGYSSDLEKMYQKNFAQFKELKYNPAMLANQESDPFHS